MQNRRMDQLENARLDWQRAQAELQIAMGGLERTVAERADADAIAEAWKLVKSREMTADEYLNRYITQLGKS
jgi:hypothetical protein